MPYSHMLTPGYNTWTDGPYGYSWDMMVHAWDTVLVTARVRDNVNGHQFYLDTSKYAASDRWSKHADMTHQFVHCIAAGVRRRQRKAEPTQHEARAQNLSIFIDVWCSLNGRFQQRVFDPNVDLLQADWSPWQRTAWILPLLHNLTALRSEINSAKWRSVDPMDGVLFVADFPGLAMDHFVSAELEAVTLTVMRGRIEHRAGPGRLGGTSVTAGTSIPLQVGDYHSVRTLGDTPSTYMYTFRNRTLDRIGSIGDPMATPGWAESIYGVIRKRCINYIQFIENIYSCLLK